MNCYFCLQWQTVLRELVGSGKLGRDFEMMVLKSSVVVADVAAVVVVEAKKVFYETFVAVALVASVLV